jgi:hypothetical protein
MTCLIPGDNRPKGLLIPHEVSILHGMLSKAPAREREQRGPRPIS